MSFRMAVFVDQEDRASPQSDRRHVLGEQIRHASKSEQDAALDELFQLARESGGDERAWSGFALGLFNAGAFEDALDVFRKLANSFPTNDLHRLNIATCHSQLAQFDLCRLQLKSIAASGATPQARQVAAEQLRGLEEWLGQTEKDQQFREMKLMALQERVRAADAQAEDYVQLARLLLEQEHAGAPGSEGDTERGREILEQGESRFPQSVPILEYLAGFYMRLPGCEEQLEKTLQKIEKLAPDSPVLELMNPTEDYARELSNRLRERAFALMRNCESKDPDLVSASLKELRKMVGKFGQIPEYRKNYAFALTMAGRYEEARREAEILAGMAGDSHNLHFHIGQVFSACADKARARHHLELALQLSNTDEDRRDTLQLLSDLKKRGGKDG